LPPKLHELWALGAPPTPASPATAYPSNRQRLWQRGRWV